ncbi:hypothetical protein [Amaricoccus sp.]|uniref:hypothetical protein n=1 Tax=Amaricoccus sp. TaxID=1872485 RepID=UPI001B6EDD54|nr:hypothetical protein [Amaricoccus sp.]MBP7241640.1 hypothetical protein [Amaricoccus sp.]
MTAESDEPGPRRTGEETPESLAEVLASIRALVSAETGARLDGAPGGDVILLTPGMRVDAPAPPPVRAGELLSAGLAEARPRVGAPILDEEALRRVINDIVREELQGELGDRISRNMRRVIRREIGQMLDEARGPADSDPEPNPDP